MNKKIIIIGVIGIMICGGITTASTVNIFKNTKSSDSGFFEARLGVRDNERPILNLEGTFNTRGRQKIVQGIEDNRFNGVFRGNMFMIRTQIRGRVQTIIGQCRHGEDNLFAGVWSSRGLQNRGWIKGEFSFRESFIDKFESHITKKITITSYAEPPDWATGYFYGLRGITDMNGQPIDPSEYIVGYCSDDFKEKFVGVVGQIDTEEVTDYIGGNILGPFMLGLTGNIISEEKSLIAGLGGSNETHFYFRTMSFIGPNNYLVGKYFPLE